MEFQVQGRIKDARKMARAMEVIMTRYLLHGHLLVFRIVRNNWLSERTEYDVCGICLLRI
jgi:hypothetical protein